MPLEGYGHTKPPSLERTNTCKKITFSQLRLQVVKMCFIARSTEREKLSLDSV